jgi:hypothetical protein
MTKFMMRGNAVLVLGGILFSALSAVNGIRHIVPLLMS